MSRDALCRFAVGTVATVLALCLLCLCLGNPLTESADRLYFLSAVCVGAVTTLIEPRITSAARPRSLVFGLAAVFGMGAVVWGLVTIEHERLRRTLWLGFGWEVAVLVAALMPAVHWLLRAESAVSPGFRRAGIAGLGVVLVVGALSFVQTSTSLSQPDHSAYVFNELYSAAAGHFPYRDFVPQYQTLLTYASYPVIAALGAERALEVLLGVLSLLSLLTVLLGVWAGWIATRGLNRLLAPTLVLPLVFLTQGAERQQWAGSISALHSAFPVRMLMPTVLGLLLARLPVLSAQPWHVGRHVVPFGLVAGLSAYHQIDFGAAAIAAAAAALATAAPAPRRVELLAAGAAACSAGFFFVPALHWLANAPLEPRTIGWFVRQFGGGFGAEPIQIPGPVLVVLPLIVGATATCLAALRAQRLAFKREGWEGVQALARLASAARTERATGAFSSTECRATQEYRAALLGAYFGVFAIAAFPYYLNRSYASGQLQILLLPLALALCACARLVAPVLEEEGARWPAIVLRAALAIPVGSVWLLPSPSHEWARLTGQHPETRWPGAKTEKILEIGQQWRRLGDRSSVGYWGNDGNYIEAITGLRNITRFNSPLDGSMSPAARAELCAPLSQEGLTTLILGEMAPDPKICSDQWELRRTKSGVVVAQRVSAAQALRD